MSTQLLIFILIILILIIFILWLRFCSKKFKFRFQKPPHYNWVILDDGTSVNLGPYSTRPCQCPDGANIIEIDEDLLGELQSGGIGHRGGGVQGENITFRWDIHELLAANDIVSEVIECKAGGDVGQRIPLPQFPLDPKQIDREDFNDRESSNYICARKYRIMDYLLDSIGDVFSSIGNVFSEQLNSPINIAILDTPCDRRIIRKYINDQTKDFNLIVSNVTCTNPYLTENTNHGTAVVIRLIEKLIKNQNTKDVHIRIYNILDSVGSVRLSSVLCALSKAKKDRNTHFNMSFGFNKNSDVLSAEFNKLLEPNTIAITCSVGNDKLQLEETLTGHTNIPSAYSRTIINDVRIYEVIGLENGNNIWQNGQKGSNYVVGAQKLYAADATINGEGGTSFAAPRILADIISEAVFDDAQEITISPTQKINAIVEAK